MDVVDLCGSSSSEASLDLRWLFRPSRTALETVNQEETAAIREGRAIEPAMLQPASIVLSGKPNPLSRKKGPLRRAPASEPEDEPAPREPRGAGPPSDAEPAEQDRPARAEYDPINVGSFFCKAKPKAVITLVNRAVAEQQQQVLQHSSGRLPDCPSPVGLVEPAASKPALPAEPDSPERGGERPVDSVPAAPPRKRSRRERLQGAEHQAPRPEERGQSAAAAPVPAPVPEADDIDPALRAALLRAEQPAAETDLETQYTVQVTERVRPDDLKPGARTKEPLQVRISRATTFGDIKATYCATRQTSPVNAVLTFREVPFYDSVLCGSTGIFDAGAMVDLVLYEKGVLAQARQLRQSSHVATMELLSRDPGASIDASQYMSDAPSAPTTGSTQAAPGTLEIRIRTGAASAEPYRIAPGQTCRELLALYAARHPGAARAQARLVFDGEALLPACTIAEAGLEDGDQVELKL